MAKKQIKALVFDLGGVVMHGGYLAFIQHYIGKQLTPVAKKRIIFLEHKVNLGSITENEFYKHIQKEFSVHLTSKQMHNKIVARMKTNKTLVSEIKTLKKAKIALFSNSLGHMAMEMVKKKHIGGKKVFDKF